MNKVLFRYAIIYGLISISLSLVVWLFNLVKAEEGSEIYILSAVAVSFFSFISMVLPLVLVGHMHLRFHRRVSRITLKKAIWSAFIVFGFPLLLLIIRAILAVSGWALEANHMDGFFNDIVSTEDTESFTRAIFVLFGISALKLIIQVGIVITLEGIWKIYTKAGQKGWQALIPIYRFLVWLKIIKKPEYWILLLFLPIVSIVYSIWMVNLLAKRFGKNESYTLGLLFLPFIFYPRLGFGPEEYIEDTKEAYGVA